MKVELLKYNLHALNPVAYKQKQTWVQMEMEKFSTEMGFNRR